MYIIYGRRTNLQCELPESVAERGNKNIRTPAGRDGEPNSGRLARHKRLYIYHSNASQSSNSFADFIARALLPIAGSIEVETRTSSSLPMISFHRSWKYTESCQRR